MPRANAKKQDVPQTRVAPNSCQRRNCRGIYFPTRIELLHDDGRPWMTMFYKLTCLACGHVKTRMFEGTERVAVYSYGDAGKFFFNPKNFNVPREMIEVPVADKKGVPVLDADGKQIYSFDPQKKLDFLRRVCSLVNWKAAYNQRFTLSQVMNAPICQDYF